MEAPNSENLATPTLPPELERTIFEIAARSRPEKIPILMLTAWRIKHWLEPLLYRAVSLSNTFGGQGFPIVPADVLLRAIANAHSSLLQAVQYVYFEPMPVSPESSWILDALLSACPRITRFFCTSSSSFSSNLQALASLYCLRRLTISTTTLFPSQSPDFAHPLFRNVTHLELLDIPPAHNIDTSSYAGLAFMPRLTHISLNYTRVFSELYPLLEEMPHLQCMVLLSPPSIRQQNMPGPHPLDDRFVHIGQTNFFRDWISSLQARGDYWDVAEAFIAARRAGRVPRSMYSISDVDMRWRA
ncbi:hypothetical protein C8R45DRAFT_985172 [Mycena sanguinolenta]|nr:hypothetical protein C8R45DRAFT_985172 [Mycena sanguinolenta]